jgi:hypothetical protein
MGGHGEVTHFDEGVLVKSSVAVLRIRDIMVRIRILGSIPLTNRSRCGSRRPKITRIPEHWYIFIIIQRKKSRQEVTKK